MIKPILYHSFEEKQLLEKKLMADIPMENRKLAAQALADLFSSSHAKAKRPRLHAVKVKALKK